MTRTTFTRSFFFLMMLLLAIGSCKKEKKKATASISASEAAQITATQALISINITTDGDYQITERGICWSTTPNPTTADSKILQGAGTSSFSATITNLTPGETYYVRGYFINNAGEITYTGQITFVTTSLGGGGGGSGGDTFSVSTGNISNITTSTATAGGTITAGDAVTARGVCWSTSQDPTIFSNKTSNGTGGGSFTSAITGLAAGTTYYVRAYATTNSGTTYGAVVSFTTTSANGGASVNVATSTISNITATGATAGGTITGNGTVTARGVCWSTAQNPTTSSSKTNDGSGNGSFTSAITGLTANTTYYVRAYATSSAGTVYGSQVNFTTSATAGLTVTTNSVSGVTGTEASSGGSVSGTGTVTSRGICWSTTQNPTVALATKTTNGSGTGSFSSAITGLTPGTTYYVRAYAVTGNGTTYGNQVVFTSAAASVTVKTLEVSYFGTNASIKASVNTDQEVIAMGLVYGTSSNPTTSNTKVSAPRLGNWEFTVSVNTPACVMYYVRAYATLKGGATYYGDQLTFKNVGPLNDCHPLNGTWANSSGTLVFSGNANGLIFQSVGGPTGVNWKGALDAGLIKTGTNGGYVSYIQNVVKTGNLTYNCSVMWYKGSNNKVTEVKYGSGKIVVSADEKQFTVSGNSPFDGNSSSGTLYKQ